jgi:hypothetical protein
MVKIEMPNGAVATLSKGEWTSTTLGLANLLERLMPEEYPSPSEGDPEYALARQVIERVSARILESTPSYEHVPSRVY